MERRPVYPHLYVAGDYRASSIRDLQNSREQLIEDGIGMWPKIVSHLTPDQSLYVAPLSLYHAYKERGKESTTKAPFYYYGAKVLVPSVRHSPEFDPANPHRLVIYDSTGEMKISECMNPVLIYAMMRNGIYQNFAQFRNDTQASIDVYVRALFSPVFPDHYSFLGISRSPKQQPAEQRTRTPVLVPSPI